MALTFLNTTISFAEFGFSDKLQIIIILFQNTGKSYFFWKEKMNCCWPHFELFFKRFHCRQDNNELSITDDSPLTNICNFSQTKLIGVLILLIISEWYILLVRGLEINDWQQIDPLNGQRDCQIWHNWIFSFGTFKKCSLPYSCIYDEITRKSTSHVIVITSNLSIYYTSFCYFVFLFFTFFLISVLA